MNLLTVLRKSRAAPPSRAVPLALPVLRKNYAPADVYVIPRVREVQTGVVIHLDQLARQYTRAALVGCAGSGKTAALNFLAQQQNTRSEEARAGVPQPLVQSLADYHPQALPRHFENPALILLDDVQPFHAAYLADLARDFPQARIFIAVREANNLPPEFVRLALQPFHERELSSAVEAWFPAGPAQGHGGNKLINRAAEAFLTAVKANTRTRLLASNPLDLFLLLQVYAEGQPLPVRRTELFDAYVRAHLQSETLVSSHSGGKAAQTGDPDFAARALEGIALSTKRGQIAQDEHLARGYGFLHERASGRVAFVHALLHEFLAARALRRNPDLVPLLEHLDDENWSTVVLFYAGLGEPRPVVEALLECGQIDLAARALGQAAEMPEDLQARVSAALLPRAWEQEETAAIASLAAVQSKPAVDFLAARLKDREPATRARAACILGQLRSDRAVEALLPQLRDTNAEVRAQVAAALGQSQNSRVVEPLLVALRGDARGGIVDTRLRAAAARALGELGAEKALPALIVDLSAEPEVRAAVTHALIQIRSEFARKPLRALVESNQLAEVRAAAEQVLERM